MKLEEVQVEPCNFKETLSKWEKHNRFKEARRVVSSPSVQLPKATASAAPARVEPPQDRRVFDHPKLENELYTPASPPEFHLTGNSFQGTAFCRTNYGEVRKSQTIFSLHLNQNNDMLLHCRKPAICAFSELHSLNDKLFNFDAIIYELARLLAFADLGGDLAALRLPAYDHDLQSDEQTLLSLLQSAHKMNPLPVAIPNADLITGPTGPTEPTGPKQPVQERAQENTPEHTPEPPDHKLVPPFSRSTIAGLLGKLWSLYDECGRFSDYCLAYLCGLFSVASINKFYQESNLFADVLASIEFPTTRGDLDILSSFDAVKLGNRSAVADILLAAALVTLSDPGGPYTESWLPVISVANTPENHIANISQNAEKFFRLWLENFSAVHGYRVTPRPTVVAAALYGLRHLKAEYLQNSLVCPWFAVEPTHILDPCMVYATYGAPLPIGPANGTVKDVKGIANMESIKRLDDCILVELNWHMLRQNLLVWLLEEEGETFFALDQFMHIPCINSRQHLPTALSLFSAHDDIKSVRLRNDGVYGILDAMIDGRSDDTVQVIVSPLVECEPLTQPEKFPPRTAHNIESISLGHRKYPSERQRKPGGLDLNMPRPRTAS